MTDDALIEAMARAICNSANHHVWRAYIPEARAALAVARPVIERETLERCAMIVEGRYWSSALGADGIPKAIAAALKETGE